MIRLYTQGLVENVRKVGDKIIFEYVGSKPDKVITVGSGGTFDGVVNIAYNKNTYTLTADYSDGTTKDFLLAGVADIAYNSGNGKVTVTYTDKTTKEFTIGGASGKSVTDINSHLDNNGNVDYLTIDYNDDTNKVLDLLGLTCYLSYDSDANILEWYNSGDNNLYQVTLQSGEGLTVASNAGAHNSIYRGKNLGASVNASQYAAIRNGTFEDLFIGDYWTINNTVYRIAAFDYWLNTGDTECTTHHVVLVPDSNMYAAKMNNSNVTTGAYVGSAMYSTNLTQAKTTVNTDFGSNHILSHREYLANAMKATADPTYESGRSWYDSTVELMNERMVYGADVFHNIEVNGAIPNNYTIGKGQLPLFALEPSRICNRAAWWLRCAVSAASFALVGIYGDAIYNNASISTYGVRPAFGIVG